VYILAGGVFKSVDGGIQYLAVVFYIGVPYIAFESKFKKQPWRTLGIKNSGSGIVTAHGIDNTGTDIDTGTYLDTGTSLDTGTCINTGTCIDTANSIKTPA
jgi:hypothetical protein